MLIKVTPSKALVLKINLVFLAFFVVVYAALLLRPSLSVYHENAAALVRCTLRECNHKAEKGVKMKAALEENQADQAMAAKRKMVKSEKPSFLNEMRKGMRIGMVNMDDEDVGEWKVHGEIVHVHFQQVSELFNWTDLFPEWIDEEEEKEGTMCPEIPMPDFRRYWDMDLIVAKLPCKYPEEGWRRDVFRLQVHLIAANLAVKKGRRDWNWRTKLVFLSRCRPMMELFRCDDLVRQEGDWWFYQPSVARLEQKVSLPVGSCKLALPLWAKGVDKVFDLSKIKADTRSVKREAYATVLHSSDTYVCGAITLAQSLLRTGTKRDLLLLLDSSIPVSKRDALAAAGWQIRLIKRIRNPKAEKDSYNEYNYSKFRLWQLTEYDKIIFIDADIIVLRNLDLLFHFPQMSATGNDGSIFNSRHHDNRTFQLHLSDPHESYQRHSFLQRRTVEAGVKNQLFGSDPPKLYSIHYLGLKPWLCYRDYDCNWDIENQLVYASDVAHHRWWKLHDAMDESLQTFCGLSERRKIELAWDRKVAGERGLRNQHWSINVTDPRRFL
ncbi:UDP-glucuronate:xylan alpha-glucuronosyltransferase 2 [Vitis vinifera]|uniref:Hexosyltransferase n=1 Tax=Vitis vinifera TaxID=29760 RepID=A0A438ITL1_VITVI|nr:UDP-glucuronate:xylan alpha-glucuronosyltransferase 2 [Vitis vinifera]